MYILSFAAITATPVPYAHHACSFGHSSGPKLIGLGKRSGLSGVGAQPR